MHGAGRLRRMYYELISLIEFKRRVMLDIYQYNPSIFNSLIMKFIHVVFFNCCLIFVNLSCFHARNEKQEDGNMQSLENKIREKNYDTLKGEKFKELINYYSKKIDSIEKIRTRLYRTSKGKTSFSIDSLQTIESAYYQLYNERNAEILKKILASEKNAESFENLLYLAVDKKMPIFLIDSLYKEFPDFQKRSDFGKRLLAKIDERKKTEILKSYDINILNAKFYDEEGKMVKLNDVSSKYLLLDFWSSWCNPCRYENRKLVKERESIIPRNDVSIIAISLDINRDKWLMAAHADGLNYLSISDLKGFESPVVKEFRIATIPHNVLIDRYGNILANNIWGEELKNFLRTL